MPRPGTDVVITEPAPSGGAILDTSQGFFVGLTERGPSDTYQILHSLKEYERHFGPRTGGLTAHDSARGFFTEKGSTLHMVRLIGAAAKASTAAVGPCDAAAVSAGTWGNTLTVGYEAEDDGTSLAAQAKKRARKPNRRAKATETNGEASPRAGELFRVVVTYGDVVERSTPIATAGEAVDWSEQSSAYVRLKLLADDTSTPDTPLAALDPVALAGGTDDDVVDEDVLAGALDLFGYALGGGQVAYPGCVDVSMHAVILAHCTKNKRCALLDLDDTDAITLAADVAGLYAHDGSKLAASLAPRIMYQGPVPGTQVLVPYSALQAGVIARSDRSTGNPNEAAAGTNGVILGAKGLAREFTDDEREQLNEAGVTLAKVIYQQVRTYGSRTCAGPDEKNWMWFANSRVICAIAHDSDAVAENYVHKQIDTKRKIFTSLEQDLGGVCLHYMTLEALWAFRIDTGPSVNTDDTIAAGEIHATIGVQTSPSAEWVLIEISKTPLGQPV